MSQVPAPLLAKRLERFRTHMTAADTDWQTVFLFTKLSTYYFTGTVQNGALFIPREGTPIFFVRKSYERAKHESTFADIRPFKSFKDVAAQLTISPHLLHTETEGLPIALFERFNKYFQFAQVRPCDLALAKTRAIKDEYELELMRLAGIIHADVMEQVVPHLLTEGVSEAEVGAHMLLEMIKRGHQGILRMGSFNSELFLGNICFGESANYHNSFDGPGGILGISPAVPLFGNHNRRLQKDELVFLDTGCGVNGYHTDKTAIYCLGTPTDEAYALHERCVAIQLAIAERLKPGAIPSAIYAEISQGIDADFDQHFMGFGSNKVKFYGHGIGLVIDEYPVIAKGFDEPLEEGMVLAVEPKRGIAGQGMVGTENTYLVTPAGGVSLTGIKNDIICVPY